MDINSFVIGLAKGKKSGSGYFSTKENDAGGLTYAFSAKNIEWEVLSALIDKSITEVDSDVTSVGNYAFHGCSQLTKANLPNATFINMYAFAGCSLLESINAPNVTSFGQYVFNDCKKIKSVDFPNTTNVEFAMFYNCNKLTSANFLVATVIDNRAFDSCYSLLALILRSESLCTLRYTSAFTKCYHLLGTVNSTYNPSGDKDCYIYVPSALVESYKSATNWSTYASQFRALEDYTVDGTITGELDPNKI